MAGGNQHIDRYIIFKYPCCCQCCDITTPLAGVNPTTVTVLLSEFYICEKKPPVMSLGGCIALWVM